MKMIRWFQIIMMTMLLSAVLSSKNQTTAAMAGELQNLKITNHHFTTTIITANQKMIWAINPKTSRYVVLELTAVAQNNTKIFSSDFVLSYSIEDKEERSSCAAIGTVDENHLISFYAGVLPRITVQKGKIYLTLAFMIESDVEKITLQQVGDATSLTYHIGNKRPYSVFVATNTGSQQLLSDVQTIIQSGGYDVVALTDNLATHVSGTTIYYAEKAESEAREISQRLMVKFGFIPTLKEMKLISDVDIVIWLGEKTPKQRL